MYEIAESKSPWNQTFLNNAAYQYYLRHDYSKAEELYVRLLNLQHDFLLGYCMLANTQLMLGNAGLADRNLEPLENRLRDDSIMKLERNQGTWEFEVSDQQALVEFYSPQEKVTYMRYLLALVRELSGHTEEAKRELQEVAIESRGHDTTQALHVVKSDIFNLQRARTEYAKELRAFQVTIEGK